MYPDHVDACNDLGALSFYEGRTQEARHYLERALSLNPADRNIRQNLAQVYNSIGEYVKAQKLLHTQGLSASISVIMLACKSRAGLEYSLRSLMLQRDISVEEAEVLLLGDTAVDTYPETNLQITPIHISEQQLPRKLLTLISSISSNYVVIARGGYTFDPAALTQAIACLDGDATLAAVAASDATADAESRLTMEGTGFLTFREYRSGLLVIRKSMFKLCETCLPTNAHSVDWLLRTLLAAFTQLQLKVKTDCRIISWPLCHDNEPRDPDLIVRHAAMINSLRLLAKSVMHPHTQQNETLQNH
jgi:hypothetical protein